MCAGLFLLADQTSYGTPGTTETSRPQRAPSSSNPPPPASLHPRPNHSANAQLPGTFCINKKARAVGAGGIAPRAPGRKRLIGHYQISRYRAFAVQYLSRSRGTGVSDAALRSGKIGPIKAERFADLANRMRVELMARTDQRQFRSPPCAVDRHSPMTFSALFGLRIEATSLFGQPLSERCVFHRSSPVFALTRQPR